MGLKRTDEFRTNTVRITLTSGLTRKQMVDSLGVHCPAVHVYMHERGRAPVYVFNWADVSCHERQSARLACVSQPPHQSAAAI